MDRVQEKMFCSGSQLIAEGAINAGCRFFAGYPITPASGIYKHMIELLQKRGDLAISAPDEISALAYCVGASMRGVKAMTATSGPGWALMIETLQYALMTETPVVIAMVQRLGPSTGGATQGAQGDVLLTEFCTSGGYTIPVLCPSTAAECYDLTVTAFNWAEQLRSPVVLLTDKEVAMTSETIDASSFESIALVDRTHAHVKESDQWRMYDFHDGADVPKFAPVGGALKVSATGSAHNKGGFLKKNDKETIEVLLHLEEKIIGRRDELALTATDKQDGANTLVVSYGITTRAVDEAVRTARARSKKVSTISLKSLFPIPEESLRTAAFGVERIVCPEENLYGQYFKLIAHLFPEAEHIRINRIGRMITPTEIENAIL